MKFTILENSSLVIILSELCPGVEKKKFKEKYQIYTFYPKIIIKFVLRTLHLHYSLINWSNTFENYYKMTSYTKVSSIIFTNCISSEEG